MAYQVFISHSSTNSKMADAIRGLLEQKGAKCWIAPRDVPPGADYAESIDEAIERSSTLVLIFSEHANVSGFVKRELERALTYNVDIRPFPIEEVEPSRAVGFYLAGRHRGYDADQSLTERVSSLVAAIEASV